MFSLRRRPTTSRTTRTGAAQRRRTASVPLCSDGFCVCPDRAGSAHNPAWTSRPARASRLYHRIAAELERAIRGGGLRSGDRLPSVRQLCQQHRISASTATLAYRWLENRALVEARPKSGYFVAPARQALPEPELDPRMGRAGFVAGDDTTRTFLLGLDDPQAMPSFSTMPGRSLLPEARLRQLTASLNRRHPEFSGVYHTPGSMALRQEIARRSVGAGVQLRPEEILVTHGGTEAIFLALSAVAKAGDTVAVESPTYFLLLEAIKSLGMRSLEIPSHPRDGLSIDALDFATRPNGGERVAACLVVPNFQNPLGSLMPVEHKRRLVALADERGFALIESDVYGETYFGDVRPPVLQGLDRSGNGNVLLCSSFSKTVAPGYRVGWIAPGRHFRAVQALKFCTSMAGARLPQEVLAEFLANGGHDHHMRRLRAALRQQCEQMIDAVARHFPAGCRLSRPQGGLILWVELPPRVDSRRLFDRARAEHIGLAPGATFSCSRRFDHFIRLHYGQPWSPGLELRIQRLGEIVAEEGASAA